jgi:hypothetical protein
VHLGVFHAGVIAGCGCADDVAHANTINAHCEVLLDIHPATGQAWVTGFDQ